MTNFQRVQRDDSSSLRAGVSGGLNTADSDLIIPFEDSPNMNNVQVDFDGMVRKRRGYKVLQERNQVNHSYLNNILFVPLVTVSGKVMVLRKEDTDLVIDFKDSTGWRTAYATHTDVFNTGVATSDFHYISVNEPLYNRVIMVNKNHAPIQFAYTSVEVSVTRGSTGTSWTVNLPPVFVATSPGTAQILSLFINGTLETIATHTSTTLTNNVAVIIFTTTNSYAAGTYTMEFVLHTWQWWAESFLLRGDQMMQVVVQGTSTQTISVPSVLLQGIEAFSANNPPMKVYSSAAYDAVFTNANPPSGSSQYAFSNGSIAQATSIGISPFFITFGAAPSAVRNVWIHRGYLLPFYGGSGPNYKTNGIDVVPVFRPSWCTRNAATPPSEGGASTGVANTNGGYHFRGRNNFICQSSTSDVRAPAYFMMDGTASASGGSAVLALDEVYQVIDMNATDIITTGGLGSNSAAATSVSRFAKNHGPEFPPVPVNSYAYPAGGLSWFSNYRVNSHPSVIGTIQGRIVLAGFELQPMTLVCSNAYDSIVPGMYSNNFDTVYALPDETSPFDLTLASTSSDRIIGLLEFNDSLFVFSKSKVFRVHNNNSVLTVGQVKYSVVADIGIPNSRCCTLTDKFPVFLTYSGVYAIVPNDTAAGYGVEEISTKVKNYIQKRNTNLADVGFILYDSSRNELYVALSDNTNTDRCGEMLVYNTQLQSWYVYTTRGGTSFQASAGALIYDGENVAPNTVFYIPGAYNDPDNIKLIQMGEEDVPFDMDDRYVYAGVSYTTSLPALRYTTTTVANVIEYNPSTPSTLERAFRLSPIRELQDCIVTLNAVTQTFGTTYVKTDRGTIRFASAPGAGQTLIVESRYNDNGTLRHPVTAYNETTGRLYKPSELTVDISGDFYRVTAITPAPSTNDIVYFGYLFPSWYATPTFNRDTLAVKSIREYIGYFQNNIAEIWDASESYPTATLVGKRKIDINANVAILFSNEYEGLVQEELFDIDTTTYPNQQVKDYTRVSVPIIGKGYNIQVIHHNNSCSTFKLAGYELKMIPKPGKGYSKSEEKLN